MSFTCFMHEIKELNLITFKMFSKNDNKSNEQMIEKVLNQYYEIILKTDGHNMSMAQIDILDIIFDVIRDIALAYIARTASLSASLKETKFIPQGHLSALLEQCDDIRGIMFFPINMILTEDHTEHNRSESTFHCNNMLGISEQQYECRFYSRAVVGLI